MIQVCHCRRKGSYHLCRYRLVPKLKRLCQYWIYVVGSQYHLAVAGGFLLNRVTIIKAQPTRYREVVLTSCHSVDFLHSL